MFTLQLVGRECKIFLDCMVLTITLQGSAIAPFNAPPVAHNRVPASAKKIGEVQSMT